MPQKAYQPVEDSNSDTVVLAQTINSTVDGRNKSGLDAYEKKRVYKPTDLE